MLHAELSWLAELCGMPCGRLSGVVTEVGWLLDPRSHLEFKSTRGRPAMQASCAACVPDYVPQAPSAEARRPSRPTHQPTTNHAPTNQPTNQPTNPIWVSLRSSCNQRTNQPPTASGRRPANELELRSWPLRLWYGHGAALYVGLIPHHRPYHTTRHDIAIGIGGQSYVS